MNLTERKNVLTQLGQYLDKPSIELDAVIARAEIENPWFTEDNIRNSIGAIARKFLDPEKLNNWVDHYKLDDHLGGKQVGLVLAGNIPLVGWQDIMAVFITGNTSLIKASSKDEILIKHLVETMIKIDARVGQYFEWVERLKVYDAVISTGSNNSARYFETYFSHVPNIIRKNRNSVAVLTGSESDDDLIALGKDIFSYFGLGCRNVSKLYVPQDYDFTQFLEVTHEAYKEMVLHNKYKNNFDYNHAIFLINKEPFLHNGCIMIKEDEALASRIATLHYEYYQDLSDVVQDLTRRESEIQCIVAQEDIPRIDVLPFGKAQEPGLMDYADGIDTVQFLLQLK